MSGCVCEYGLDEFLCSYQVVPVAAGIAGKSDKVNHFHRFGSFPFYSHHFLSCSTLYPPELFFSLLCEYVCVCVCVCVSVYPCLWPFLCLSLTAELVG